mmetsp:Transcript_43080/g.112109  ORF Transcript_43080/g.112109 Transcript_43080/m.112109 type:complete len:317 (-) Transcript_43080:147-1097(-)
MMIEVAAAANALRGLSNETAATPAQLLQSADWVSRGSWILHGNGCAQIGRAWESSAYELTPCGLESLHALLLLVGLCTTIVMVVCAFAFFREDKEEHITPLCPQMVVSEQDLNFTLRIPTEEAECTPIVGGPSAQCRGKVSVEWPDPLRPGSSGVAATVRLRSPADVALATVVARNVAVVGQGLALCRAGCEIFGFVEPKGPRRYHVRHRTGVHLLTLVGDFASLTVEGINPVGSKVCWFQRSGDELCGRVLQHVDAGLAICSLLATHVHRRLLHNALVPRPIADQEELAARRSRREGEEVQPPVEAEEAPEPERH